MYRALCSRDVSRTAESQALLNRAIAMVEANALTPEAATAPRAPVDGGESTDEPAEQSPDTDVDEP